MNPKYTETQIADIQSREVKAIEALKELEMTISAQVVSVNVGDNTFAQKVIPYLADMKYSVKEGDVPSEVMNEKVEENTEENTEAEKVEGEIIEPTDEPTETAV